MTELTTTQSVKQSVRQLGVKASDAWKITGTKISRSDTKDLDVALVKATSARTHVPPKEKHVRTLKLAVSGSYGGPSTSYVVSHLLERLHQATDWLTALKTLSTLHRLMAETSTVVWDELLRGPNDGQRPHPLSVDNFIDTTNIAGRFDFSEFVRAYGKYLDEQLVVWAAIRWTASGTTAVGPAPHAGEGWPASSGAEAGPGLSSPATGTAGPNSPSSLSAGAQTGDDARFRNLPAPELLRQLPYLQRLLRRLVDCVPRGAAANDAVARSALDMVVRESFRLYKAVSEGVISLADAYFSMPYLEAVKGLELYREAGSGTEALSLFYGAVGQLGGSHGGDSLPALTPPPEDFVASMEAYLAEAPVPDGAPSPALRRGPLRKGRGAPGTGTQAGVNTPAARAVQRTGSNDPGMLLALPRVEGEGQGQAEASPAATVASPVASPAPGSAPGSAGGLLAMDTPKQQQPPSIMDLLSELTVDAGPAAAPAGAPHDPFAFPGPGSTSQAPAFGGTGNPDPFAFSAQPPPQQQQWFMGGGGGSAAPWPATAAAPAAPPAVRDPFAPPVTPQPGVHGTPAPVPAWTEQSWPSPGPATMTPGEQAWPGTAPLGLPGAHRPPPLDVSFFGGPVDSVAPQSGTRGTPGGAASMRGAGAGPVNSGGSQDLVAAAGARDPFAALSTLTPGGSHRNLSPGGMPSQ